MRYFCIFILPVLAAVLLCSLAKPLPSRWDDQRTKHSWNAVPKDWESKGRPPLSTTIDLYITLKPQSENALIDVLYNVSTPGHPEHVLHPFPHQWTHMCHCSGRYGKHLSKEQVAELVAPHPRTLKLVKSWLKHNGIPSSSVMRQGGNTLMLKAVPVSKANTLLDASYQVYRHVESHETIVRTVGYGLPAVLHEHVRTVVPTTAFVPSLKQWQIPLNISGGATAASVNSASGQPTTMLSSRVDPDEVDLNTLRWMYHTAEYTVAKPARNLVGMVGAVGDMPSQEDLRVFMEKYRTDAVTANIILNHVNLSPDFQPNALPDANVQYLEAFVFPNPVVYYVTGRGHSNTDDWFMTWLRYLEALPNPPRTISGSFNFIEDTLPLEYADQACQLFARLGARGVTILFASGDDGIGEGDCLTNDGLLKFRTGFPATCPYVTAVGGTIGSAPRSAAKFSGGGFSNYFERPDFQIRAVHNYLRQLGSRNAGLYNPFGRGIPDLSAQAVGLKVVVNGIEGYYSSTGTTTAVVAGIVGLLNDWLLFRVKNPLGWLNPWLYGNGFGALTDIRRGENGGCNIEGLGFPALEGWDPVTGIGTPDFLRMQASRD
ncbi:peptidase S8/S53 domain-containing protein [Lactarius quietus]|nr:peptidase S8/S53 domain-containing protein [Lactarius quietus]KAF8265268.1 peptidase S8/S53 domain-containing protein [Lactarius quietus]